MPSSNHSPYGMDKRASPFGDLDDEHGSLPNSQVRSSASNTNHNTTTTRAPRNALDSPAAAAALAAHPHTNSNSSHTHDNASATNSHSSRPNRLSENGGGGGNNGGNNNAGGSSTNPSSQTQRRLSDFNASNSGLLEGSLTFASSPRQLNGPTLPPMAPPMTNATPPGVKSPVQEAREQPTMATPPPSPPLQPQLHQQQQQKQIPPPPQRIVSPIANSSPPVTRRETSMLSAPDGGLATMPPTATRRTVGFANNNDGAASSTLASTARQTSNGFSDPHASILGMSDTRRTQRPSEANNNNNNNNNNNRSSEMLSATIPKSEEPAYSSSADASKSVMTDSAKRRSSNDKEDAEGDAEGDGENETQQPSSHNRYNKAYANLVITKPSTSEVPENATATMLPGTDPRDEAQIRSAGTLGSTRLPVFDRAKAALFTPGLANAGSPRLRHGRQGSGRDDSGPLDLSTGGVDSNNNSTSQNNNNNNNILSTPQSARRRLSMLITPLLRTPIHRQQTSGISSPLVVDRSVLEEPARSPATFGDRLKELNGDDDDKAIKIHMVWQMREGQTRCTLSPNFILASVNDRVCIHWYDSSEEVFETDQTYLNVVPGGRHSCYNTASTPSGDDDHAMNDGNAEAFEMNQVWSAPEDANHEGTTSHRLGRAAGGNNNNSNGGNDAVVTVKPQLDKSEPSAFKKDASTPLVIRVRTPRPGRTDSLGGPLTLGDSIAGTPGTARGALRSRRLASEVFMTREEGTNDASNRVSNRSDQNLRETNLFASGTTPLVTGHSRQPSSSWMLQRSATRQSVGENYQSFTISFQKSGDYYFVCSKHKRTMRLHVQVQSERSLVRWRWILVIGAAVLIVALIVIVVVVLAYWMQHSTFLFGKDDSATYEQYIAFLNIHDLITLKLFPFLAVGVLVVLIVILAAIGWSVYRCFLPARQGAYTRGVYTHTRRIFALGTALLTFALIVLLFVAFGLEMNVMNGVNQLALSIGSGVTSTLNLYSTAVVQVNYIVNESAVLFPDISIPTDQIFNITSDVSSLMSQIIKWTSFVEDIAQVAFRVIPIVIFLAMQLGLFAACLTIGAIILHFRKAAVATTWMLAASFGIFSIVCGIEFAITKLFSNIYSSVVVLRDDPSDFGNTLGLANNSFVSQLLSYCTITIDDVSVISNYVNEILTNINNSLDAEGQKDFASVFEFIQGVVPTTLEALSNYTDYIAANLDVLQKILDDNGAQVNDLVHQNVVPMLQTLLSVVQTLKGLVNCQVIRDIVATAIPIFKNEVSNYNLAVFSFLLIVFGISFILFIFSAGATYALRNPRRTWCNMRSGRWFRFRYSYKTHIATLMQGAKVKTRPKTVLQWMVHHTEPIMYQLQTVKLVCYSACALMFFDCILIVLFNEVSRGTRTSKMLQAISYLGCATLLFLLLAALFRRALIRWIFHFCSLLCAGGCLGVAVSQAIVGFVYFGQCVDHTRYEMSSLTYGSPVYLTCSATYMGYNLEVAIYAVIIFFNSITVVVTLAIQIRYERNLKASFQHRHYIGVLSPLEKFFPWLKCVFVDYLYVKRIYYGLLIFVTVVFLVCFAVLDIGQWSVIRGVTKQTLRDSDIVQVIDPTVGCNGDSRYCDLRANQIIWACAHNAHSSLEDGFVLPNHYYNITHQLAAGIRSFMVDVWYDKINSTVSDEEDVYVCHTLCLMGRRRWRDVAREFKLFLDKYPEQVIMIIFEQYVNSSSLGEIQDDVGLTQYTWFNDQVPPNYNPDYKWPTLRQLINKNQRALMYNDELATANRSKDCPEWLYYSFDFQYENFYTTLSVNDWVCDIHRGWCTADPVIVNCSDPDNVNNSACVESSSSSQSGSLDLSASSGSLSSSSSSDYNYLYLKDITNCTEFGADMLWKNGSAVYNRIFNTNPPNIRSKMSTMNHFITNGAGSPVQATQANQAVQVQSTTYMCSSTWNTVVNILAFDFWNIANPLGTIQAMNQNIAKYGNRYNFQDQWSKMLFGTDSVSFDTD